MADTPHIEAVDRALVLLTALADAGPDGASLAELAEATGVNKSTAYRALSTLRSRAFATQAPTSGRYGLGPAAMALGEVHWAPSKLAASLHPALMAVCREVDELVHLGVVAEDYVVYIDKVEPERAIRVWSAVGQRVPAATTALGRALLAARGVPDEQLAAYLHVVPTERGLTLAQLRATVREARQRGYSQENEENEPGVACIGMAVLREGRAVAALSITSLAERMTPGRRDELAAAVRRTAGPLLPPSFTLAVPERVTAP